MSYQIILFFIGAQFHPEFKSRPGKPSPLFVGLIAAATGQLDAFLDNPSLIHDTSESTKCNLDNLSTESHHTKSAKELSNGHHINGLANGADKEHGNGSFNGVHKEHANGSLNGVHKEYSNGYANGSLNGIYSRVECVNGPANGVYSDHLHANGSLNGIYSNGNGLH